jgi:hypothetical protein
LKDAVQAWLCWLYTLDYNLAIAVSSQKRPFFDADVLKVADKYGQVDLTDTAHLAFAARGAQLCNQDMIAL